MAQPFYSEGRFLCRIIDQALGKAQTGTTQFVLLFLVLESVDRQEEVTQYERTAYLAITERTIEYVIPKLKTLGFNRDSFRFLDPNESNHQSFVDQQVEMYCKHENNRNGDLQEKWDVARAASELKVEPADRAEVRKLDMLFGKHLKSGNASSGTRSSGRSEPAPAEAYAGAVLDDDAPF